MVRGYVQGKAHVAGVPGVKTIIYLPVVDSSGANANGGSTALTRKRASERVRKMRTRLISHSKESYSLLSKKRYSLL